MQKIRVLQETYANNPKYADFGDDFDDDDFDDDDFDDDFKPRCKECQMREKQQRENEWYAI